MKKQSHSAGFGVLEIILVVAVVGLLGFLGYYVYSQQNKPADTQNTQTQTDANSEEKTETTQKIKEYVEIKEWGLKVALRDYDKVDFKVQNQSGYLPGDEYTYEAVAGPSFKKEFLQDDTCEPGLSLFRSKISFNGRAEKKIGEYYYTVAGGPGRCSDDPENNPDDQLKTRFLQDFTIENVSSVQ
jgi:Tfp pilus assembly protein PilE